MYYCFCFSLSILTVLTPVLWTDRIVVSIARILFKWLTSTSTVINTNQLISDIHDKITTDLHFIRPFKFRGDGFNFKLCVITWSLWILTKVLILQITRFFRLILYKIVKIKYYTLITPKSRMQYAEFRAHFISCTPIKVCKTTESSSCCSVVAKLHVSMRISRLIITCCCMYLCSHLPTSM